VIAAVISDTGQSALTVTGHSERGNKMQRKVFDLLVSVGGAIMVVVLLVAGGLLLWGASFANSNVHNQLTEQQITFPSAAAFAHPKAGGEITPSMIPTVSQYAGQQLTTGAQAEVYANDFIAAHLAEIGGGKTYAQLSAAAMALPKGSAAYTAAEAKAQTVFQGTTLRGLLLEAYAFSVIGTIAMVAAIAAFILAGLLALIVVFGFWHERRVPETQELEVRHTASVPAGIATA
jgi:cytoskeletal protein RodZ